MTKLTDTQRIILAAAARRDDRAALPLPKSIKANRGAVTQALRSLLRKELLTEEPCRGDQPAWRREDPAGPLTLLVTDAGLAAMGVEPDQGQPDTGKQHEPTGNGSKAARIAALLGRAGGASMSALQRETGWQPHSIRAAVTGLRKQGMVVERERSGNGDTVYRISGA